MKSYCFVLIFFFPSSLPYIINERSDFGGDFSSVSGSEAPGPTANTMGDKAASAMAIGTGSSGTGDYASNYKTPNYTQYTSQDFKEFMPNYQEMMESSMDKMSGMGSGSSGISFSNFSAVGSMLKGFVELQKEQLAFDRAKAETNKVTVIDNDVIENSEKMRKKRSSTGYMMTPPSPFIPSNISPSIDKPSQATAFSSTSTPTSSLALNGEETTMLKRLIQLIKMSPFQSILNTDTTKSWTPNIRQMTSFSPSSSPSPSPSSTFSQLPQSSQSSQSSQSTSSGGNSGGDDWKKYMEGSSSNSGDDWSKYMESSGSSWNNLPPSKKTQGSGWGGASSTNGGWNSGTSSSPSPTYQSSQPLTGPGTDKANSWSTSSSQRRSLSEPMSMSPVHGAMSLSNFPAYSQPSPNIPNLSFSLNPSPSSEEVVEEGVEDVKQKEVLLGNAPIFMAPSPMTQSLNTLPPPPPPSLPQEPYGVLTYARPTYYNAPSPIYYTSVPTTIEPQGGNKPLVGNAVNLYRLGRGAVDKEDDTPISIYKVTKDDKGTFNELKKIIFDPDNGVIVSESSTSSPTRKKRSAEDKEIKNEGSEIIPFVHVPFFEGSEKLLKINHHYEDKTNSTDSRRKRSNSSGYQYQTSKEGTDVDYDNEDEQYQRKEEETRSVKVGLTQKGDLPAGSSETVSAGGGQSPGHHEGGGLTVQVNKDEERSAKEARRKTLNFYFTW